MTINSPEKKVLKNKKNNFFFIAGYYLIAEKRIYIIIPCGDLETIERKLF